MNKFKAWLRAVWERIKRIPVVIGGTFLLFVSFPVVVPICAALAVVPVSAAVVTGVTIADGKRRQLRSIVILVRLLISIALMVIAILLGVAICNHFGWSPFPWG